MVAVARALSGDVRVLLLDEPFEGLAPAVVEQLFESFDRLRREVAIVIVDHHLDLALALSDRTVAAGAGPGRMGTGNSKVLRDDLELRPEKSLALIILSNDGRLQICTRRHDAEHLKAICLHILVYRRIVAVENEFGDYRCGEPAIACPFGLRFQSVRRSLLQCMSRT